MVKKNIFAALCIIALGQNALAITANEFLDEVRNKVQDRSTQAENADLLLQRVSCKSTAEDIKEYQESDKDYFFTPLSMAVSLGRLDLLNSWLPSLIIGANTIYDPKFFSWGYRQQISLAHVAMDPYYPRKNDVSLETRLGVIDRLSKYRPNFNFMHQNAREGDYNPPPIAGGLHGGTDREERDALQARALIWGADPTLRGSPSGSYAIVSESQAYQRRISALASKFLVQIKKAEPETGIFMHEETKRLLRNYLGL